MLLAATYAIETVPERYFDWIGGAAFDWVTVVGILAFAVIVASFVVGTIFNGPWRTERVMYGVLRDAAGDLLRISPRRIGALAWLAIKESLSRWVLVAFVVYVLLVMFLSWFMRDKSIATYIDYLLFITAVLVIVVGCFLSAFSLPSDIAHRTIYTVVTKPVRASEIVLGRILGITAVGTALLAASALIGYVFVVRTIAHEHVLLADAVSPVRDARSGEVVGYEGQIKDDSGHSHYFSLDEAGRGTTSVQQGHYHEIVRQDSANGGPPRYVVSAPLGVFNARAPIFGKLEFTTRDGSLGEGINVGDEWNYRKYIEGGTRARAMYTFSGLTPGMFPEREYPKGVPLEMDLGVFRSFKGEIDKGIGGTLIAHRPGNPEAATDEIPFTAKEFVTDRQFIPRKWTVTDGDETKEMDLFRDVVRDGSMTVVIACEVPGQYFGMGTRDVYLLEGEQSFVLNYVKGCLGIWLQLLLATSIGVMWSTIVNTAVSLLATVGCLILGFFTDTLAQIGAGENLGGGVFESMLRIERQFNQTQPLDPGAATQIIKSADTVASQFLKVVTHVLPDFTRFYNVPHVAHGYNIGADSILIQLTVALSYVLPVIVAGYFFLKLRELAK